MTYRRVKIYQHGWHHTFDTREPYFEQSSIDPAATAVCRAALAEEMRYETGWKARREAKETFALQAEAAACYQVRRAHLDWFHPNGNKRGAYKQQIEELLETTRRDLWHRLVPESARSRFDGTPVPPTPPPPPPPTPEQEQRHREWLAQQEAEEAREWEELLAREERRGDPALAARARAALAALDALPKSAQGSDEHWAAENVYYEARDALHVWLRCTCCGETEQLTVGEYETQRLLTGPYAIDERGQFGLAPHVCSACETTDRRAKLQVNRNARQAAQRRAQMRVAQPAEE